MRQVYILDENWEPKAVDYGETLNNERFVVQLSMIYITDNIFISTIFIGVNFNFMDDGPPILWETMIFSEREVLWEMRYSSREAAIDDHLTIVEYLKAHLGSNNMPNFYENCQCPACREWRQYTTDRIRRGLSADVREGRSIADGIMESIALEGARHKRGPVPKINADPEKQLDEVEWELVRADIAEKKAEAEKNGAMDKWRKDQGLLTKVISPRRIPRRT
jgi:hypothetical protein